MNQITMPKEDLIDFVNLVTNQVAASINEELAAGRMPKAWNCTDIRLYLARAFEYPIPTTPEYRKRKRDFNNDCMVHGLRY